MTDIPQTAATQEPTPPTRSHDNAGREYARVDGLKAGDRVEVDAGFGCMPAGEVKAVESNEHGRLFVGCAQGRHFLSADGDHYVGLYLVDRAPTVPAPTLAAEVATLRERNAALEKALRMNGKEFAELSNALGKRGLIDLSDDCRLAAEDIARALLAPAKAVGETSQ